MGNRVLLGAAGVSLAAAVAAGGYAWTLTSKIQASERQIALLRSANSTLAEARGRDSRALGTLKRRQAENAAEAAALRNKLDEALAANPAWANGPVPNEVQEALNAPLSADSTDILGGLRDFAARIEQPASPGGSAAGLPSAVAAP